MNKHGNFYRNSTRTEVVFGAKFANLVRTNLAPARMNHPFSGLVTSPEAIASFDWFG
jgi:hypothetical protein